MGRSSDAPAEMSEASEGDLRLVGAVFLVEVVAETIVTATGMAFAVWVVVALSSNPAEGIELAAGMVALAIAIRSS